MPLGLLHNGDYASSYSRNVSIPAAHQNTDVPCQGMYVFDLIRLRVSSGHWPVRFSSSLCRLSLDWHKVISFQRGFGVLGNMWDLKLQWKLAPGSMTPVT